MMSKVTFDYSKASSFVQEHEMQYMSELAAQAKDKLLAKTGAGNDFLGWIDLPVDYDKEEFARIKKAAEKIREDSEVLLVIGIGGSYLGARAAIEFLGHSFANVVSKEIRKAPEIYYVGNSISSTYIKDLIDVVGDRDFSINMISKSGTTTEPAIAFRVFKEILEKKYGKEEAAKRIYATTDRAKGALKNLATEEGYETFVVPDDVGGRFSVLTAVGLLPIAVSGADIDKLMEGAAAGRKAAIENDFADNDAMKYAAIRNILLRKGKTIQCIYLYPFGTHFLHQIFWILGCPSNYRHGVNLLGTGDNLPIGAQIVEPACSLQQFKGYNIISFSLVNHWRVYPISISYIGDNASATLGHAMHL